MSLFDDTANNYLSKRACYSGVVVEENQVDRMLNFPIPDNNPLLVKFSAWVFRMKIGLRKLFLPSLTSTPIFCCCISFISMRKRFPFFLLEKYIFTENGKLHESLLKQSPKNDRRGMENVNETSLLCINFLLFSRQEIISREG